MAPPNPSRPLFPLWRVAVLLAACVSYDVFFTWYLPSREPDIAEMVKKGSIRQPTLWVQQIGEAWRTWTGSTGVYVLILLLLAEYWRAGIADRINQPLLGWLFYLSLLVIIPLVLVVCLNLS